MRKRITPINLVLNLMIFFGGASICLILLSLLFLNTELGKFILELLAYTLIPLGILVFLLIFSIFLFKNKTSYIAILKNIPQEFEKIYKSMYEKYIKKIAIKRNIILLKVFLGKLLTIILIIYVLASLKLSKKEPIIMILFFGLFYITCVINHIYVKELCKKVDGNIFYYIKIYQKYYYILIAVFLLYYLFINKLKVLNFLILGIMLVSIRILLHKNLKKEKLLYRKKYKEEVLKNLVDLLNFNATYELENINKKEFYKYRFDVVEKNSGEGIEYLVQDIIEGQIEEWPIKICYIQKYYDILKDREKREAYLHNYSYFKRHNHSITNGIFEGILAYVDCLYISTNIIISSKKSYISNYFGYEKNNTNNKMFEKYFNLYYNKSPGVKKILADGLIDIVMKIYNKYHIDFDLFLLNGRLYIKINSFAAFEPEILDLTKGKRDLYTRYCFLKFILDLTKEIKMILDRY